MRGLLECETPHTKTHIEKKQVMTTALKDLVRLHQVYFVPSFKALSPHPMPALKRKIKYRCIDCVYK